MTAWRLDLNDEASICRLCDWWFPLHDGVDPLEEHIWKGASVLHGLLRHPAEHHAATGFPVEERLAVYQREMGDLYDPLRRFALGEHLLRHGES